MGTPVLSDREMRVASLVAAGYPNCDIARETGFSVQVVKNVLHSLFDKLGLWNRVELANYFANGSSREQVECAQARIEAQRVAELRRMEILDTGSEQIFDELTALAVSVFNVPIALVVLVDSARAWFKSRIGMEAAEVERETSICHHTIQQSKVLVVNDAPRDPRFRCSPLIIEEPKVRFYAAAPIITDDGYALGVICVVGTVPREVTEQERTVLQSLAALARTHLELRKQLLEVMTATSEAA